MIRPRSILIIVGVVAVIALAGALALTTLLDLGTYRSYLAGQLEIMLNRKVDLGKASIAYDNGIVIQVRDVTIKEPDGTSPFLSVEQLRLGVDLWQLRHRKFIFNHIHLIRPTLRVERRADGAWNFGDLLNTASNAATAPEPWWRALVIEDYSIRDAAITFTDRLNATPPRTYRVSNLHLSLRRLRPGGRPQVNLRARLDDRTHSSEIEARIGWQHPSEGFSLAHLPITTNVKLRKIALAQLAPYLSNHPSLPVLDGLVNLDVQIEGQLGGRFTSSVSISAAGLRVEHAAWFGAPLAVRQFALKTHLESDGENLQQKEGKLTLDGVALNFETNLTKFRSPERSLALLARIPRYTAPDHLRYIPTSLLPDKMRRFVEQDIKGGTLSVYELLLNGRLKDILRVKPIAERNLLHIRAIIEDSSLVLGKERLRFDDVSGDLELQGSTLHLRNFVGRIGDSRFKRLSGRMTRLFSATLLEVRGEADANLMELRNLFRTKHKSPKVRAFVTSLQRLKGRASGRFRVVKAIGRDGPWIFGGRARVEGSSLFSAQLGQPLDDVSAEFIFHNSYVYTEQMRGRMDGVPYTLSGSYGKLLRQPNPLRKAPTPITDAWMHAEDGKRKGPTEYDVHISSDLSIADALKLAQSRFVPETVKRELATVRQAEGEGQLRVHLRKVATPRVRVLVNGSAQLARISGVYPRLRLPLAGFHGTLMFANSGANRGITLTDMTGAYGETSVHFNGRYGGGKRSGPRRTSRGGRWRLDLNASVELDDVWRLLSQAAPTALTVSGQPDLTLRLAGRGATFDVRASVDLSHLGYAYASWLLKEPNVVSRIQVRGKVLNARNGIIDEAIFATQSGLFVGKGAIKNFRRPRIDLSLATDGWPLGDVIRQLRGFETIQVRGAVRGAVRITGPLFPRARTGIVTEPGPRFTGNLSIAEGRIEFCSGAPARRRPAVDFDSQMVLTNGELQLTSLNAKLHRVDLSLSGTLRDYYSPSIAANYRRVRAIIEEYFFKDQPLCYLGNDPGPTESLARLYERRQRAALPRSWELQGAVSVTTGKVLRYAYRNMRADLRIKEGKVRLDNLQADFYGGGFSGAATIDLSRALEQPLRLTFSVRGAAVDALMRDVWQRGDLLTGQMKAKGSLAGSISATSGFTATLGGKLDLQVTKGTMQKFSVPGKIFSLLNIWQIFEGKVPNMKAKGLPFERLVGSFALVNGVAKTSDIEFDSSAAKATAVGTVDLAQEEYNLDIGVQPLQTLDKVISSIPIIGHILTGRKKRLVVSYVRLRGSFYDPRITPVPFQHLGRGMLGIFKRFLEIPNKLVPKIDEAAKDDHENSSNDGIVDEEYPLF